MPTRGKARKIGVRVEARPVASARQNGELADSAEQHGHVHPHPVGHVDRLVGIVDADVDVHAEDELLAGDEAQRGDEVAVARAGDDPLVLPHRERVRARGADRQPAARRLLITWRRSARSCSPACDHVRARLGRDLEHRLHQLGLDLPRRRGLEHRLDRVDQLERLGVEDHQLLLDADRVSRPR